jgi:hypothetical protein
MDHAAPWQVEGDETDRNVVKRSWKFRVSSWRLSGKAACTHSGNRKELRFILEAHHRPDLEHRVRRGC